MKTSRVGRVVQILTTLHSGRDYSSGDISKMFGTSQRTVFRDLKELASIGVPYRYNAKTKGYAIDPEFFLPPINLNVREALSLLMLVHKVRNQVQLPFKNVALLAALKIENNLPAQIRKHCNSTLRCISTKSPAQAPTELLDKRFGELQETIAKKQKVMLCYASLFDGKTIGAEVCPYHLLYNQRAWYLLGYSLSHKAVRTFKLNRIKELKVLEEQFSHGDDFDAQEYVGRA